MLRASVVADLGGGHGDADGRVLLLGLGAPFLGVRHGGASAADGRHGRGRRREHDGAASLGGPGLGGLLGRRQPAGRGLLLAVAVGLGGLDHGEAAAARGRGHRHGGEGRHRLFAGASWWWTVDWWWCSWTWIARALWGA